MWKASLVQLPFALWLYRGIEQLPLAAEENHDAKQDMPRGILSGLVTLILCAFLSVAPSAGMAPGAAAVGRSNEPLFLGFHTIIFAYGRQIYSLSRAGYFPAWLSVTRRLAVGTALDGGARVRRGGWYPGVSDDRGAVEAFVGRFLER